nr:HNH endonuclease family protein [Zooshikella ganghwensis]
MFSNPSDLDIDHIVPLKEAFRSGASLWNATRKREFANDLENLLAVSNSANRQKGDKDPTHWTPENWNYQCDYILDFGRQAAIAS